MKKYLFIGLLLACMSGYAQVKVFKTYQDYQNSVFVEYKDFKNRLVTSVANNTLILVDNADKTVKLVSDEYWGFEYKGRLFRLFHSDIINSAPVCVVSQGKICYYENGVAHLDALFKNKDVGFYGFVSGTYFFSKTLDSPIASERYTLAKDRIIIQELFNQNPEYTPLYDCLLAGSPELKSQKANLPKITVKKGGESYENSAVTSYIMKLKPEEVRNCVRAFNGD